MIIRILGSGCAKCKKLEVNALKAVEGLEIEVQKVTDISEITSYGVMMTPALVIDERVVSSGKILSPEKIKEFL